MELDDVKIQALQKEVSKIPEFIITLCNMREEINEVKRAEWDDTVRKIKEDIESDQMLLFIGPFSSGKSTFVNALLGEGLLPTDERPCTSVVTELSFTVGGGHRGKTVGMDGSVEKGNYQELIKMIDGPRGAVGRVGQFHHIELYFDVQQLTNWESHPLSRLERLNVKIIDCPGYGSPYITNEDIIEEYIQKASFTFWMSPADQFGGMLAERRLSNIKKNTTALIPVITKADRIDDAKREQVIQDYYEHLSHLFPRNKEPRFVSALKWLETRELDKRINPILPRDEMQREELEKVKQKRDKLALESGLEQIYYDIIQSGQKRIVTESKLASALFDLTNLFKDIDSRAEKEESYWLKEAQKRGWNEDEPYKRLTEIKKKVDVWIKSEAVSVADNLETAMIKELADYIMEANGKVESQIVSQKVYDLWYTELNKHKNNWAEYLCKEYEEYAREYSVNFSDKNNFKPPALSSITADFDHVIKGILEAFRYAGPQATLMCSAGAALLVGMPVMQGVAVIGGALAAIAGIAGVALIAVGAVPLLPVIMDKIRARKEQYRKEMEGKLREWMKKLDIAPIIQIMLNEENQKLYESYKMHFDTELLTIERKLEKSREIKEGISEMRERISMFFPEEARKAAI